MNMNSQSSYQNPTTASTSASNWLNNAIGSIKNTANDAATAAKKATNSTMSSLSSLYPTSTSGNQNFTSGYPTSTPVNQMYTPSTQYDSRISGGMKRKKKGGYRSNISLNNIASTGAPINGIPTAKPQVWVGGKTKKKRCTKRHKHVKSCKSKKTKRRM